VLYCEHDIIELAATAVVVAKLRELIPRVPLALLSSAMPPTSGAFIAAEDAKAMRIDARDPTKTVQIEASSNPK
jgi:hypothetical protein